MKLIDLRPKWITLAQWASDRPFYIGMSFDCPHCRTQRLAAVFQQPVDPTNVAAEFIVPYTVPLGLGPAWKRSGDTFECLSLSPSFDASAIQYGGHWHGFIFEGEVR
jgi:hypothetical protein